ncbi:MAG TPA: hypothetical protein VK327_13790, partial [Candidatus Paceibacterota bacterium]|nr:hypothetical protein [Candidatus Paceibacterota bacterium]
MINTASLTVRRESPLDQADWNARIARLPGTGIFHTREWAAVLHDTYGFSPVYFCATEAGRTVGLLPVMEVASWATGKRGVSLPFTDHCEPSATSKNTAELLLKVAQDFGRSRGWKYIETRGGSNVLEPDATPSLSFHSHHLDLPEQPDKLI